MVSAVLGRRHLEMSETRHAATMAWGPIRRWECPVAQGKLYVDPLPEAAAVRVNASLGASLDASLDASGVLSRRP